jgi:acetyl esterase/lipase
MLSAQAYLMRFILSLRRPFVNWKAPPQYFRDMMSRQERIFRPPSGVEIQAVPERGNKGEWIVPTDAPERPVILYLHGGAWVLGWSAIHRRLVAHLCLDAGLRAFAVDYRVAPEHTYPAALDDCVAAYRWLVSSGIAPHDIVIAGDSAGGNLTLTTMMSLRDAGDPLPALGVCISPSTDLAGTGATFRTKKDLVMTPEFVLKMRGLYAAGQDMKSPLLSPLFGDLQGLPPLLVHAGGEEMLLSDATRLADAARDAGVDVTLAVWPGMWHVWHLMAPMLPEARQAIAAIAAFIRERLAPRQPAAASANANAG